jgi:hypothetical protein
MWSMDNIRTIYMKFNSRDNFHDRHVITTFFKRSRAVSDEIRTGEHIHRDT